MKKMLPFEGSGGPYITIDEFDSNSIVILVDGEGYPLSKLYVNKGNGEYSFLAFNSSSQHQCGHHTSLKLLIDTALTFDRSRKILVFNDVREFFCYLGKYFN